MQGLRTHDMAAGATLAEYERALLARAPAARAVEAGGPLRSLDAVVGADWIDYNGHVHESRFLRAFGDATDALLRSLGLRLDGGDNFFTVETHLRLVGQARAGDAVFVTTQVLDHDAKRLHVFHALYRGDDLLATAEQMLLHVDAGTGRAAPASAAVLARVRALAEAHAGLPRPAAAGRAVGVGGRRGR
jgi:carnitine 3-dehydrogenase